MTTDNQAGDASKLATVTDDGGERMLSRKELQYFKDEAARIGKSGRYLAHSRRWSAERTRFAIWDGQSEDGRKHADAQGGKPPLPWEGASDARIRLADMICNEHTLLLVAAATRNLPRVHGLDVGNESLGTKLTTLLKWVIRNKLGAQYLREITKIAQYTTADSPAGCVLGVWWEEEWALELRTLTLQDLATLLTLPPEQGGYGVDAQRLAMLDAQLQNPDKDAETGGLLNELVPELTPKRCRIMARELREDGQCQFPMKYKRLDQPALCAYRLYDDIFLPANTTDVRNRLRFGLLREWVSETELRERIETEDYEQTFVDEVLKHVSQSAFPEYETHEVTGEWTAVSETELQELHYGEYELLTAYFRATNDDNVPGIYCVTFHHQVDEAAGARRLCDYAHGEYPFTWFGREILGSRLMDSRGVPELAATQQSALKQLHDSFHDHCSISTLPNLLVPRRRSKLSLVIKPLGQIKEDRIGDVRFMQPPEYPRGNDKQQESIQRFVDEYFGRISEKVPPLLSQLHQSGMVTQFLASLADALKQMLQLCQQYMSDEELALITGDDGQRIAHNRQEIQGQFAVELDFDPANLNMEYFKEVATLVLELVLKADTLGVVQRDKLIQWILSSISPTLAQNIVQPIQTAQQNEISDEENNFAKIAAGVEPAMVADGLNFPLRLQVIQGIVQKNPDALDKLSPTSREILQARVKYLQNQVQQSRNAQIGRQVGQPALEQNGSTMGVSRNGT